MNCPYCKNEMKKGYIAGDRLSLRWMPSEVEKMSLIKWLKRGVKLSYVLDGNCVDAFYCEQCEKVIIDVENVKTKRSQI